jgi:hypothetical protein
MSAVSKHRAPWSPAEVEQLESMMSEQIALTEIAVRLGRTEKAVETKFNGLHRQRHGPKAGKRLQRRTNGASFFLS